MGSKPSSMLQDEEITLISEETGFSPAQIERLYRRFTALDRSGNGSLSRHDCLAIPELAINPLSDRIVHMFFVDCDEDHERINFRQFMKVLATFRSSNKSSPVHPKLNSVSRQESLNQQQQQAMIKQAPLLFDRIDPTSLSALSKHHLRHSSYQEGLYDNHHTSTNQHSFHYATPHHYASNNNISSLLSMDNENKNHLRKYSEIFNPGEPLNSQKHKLYSLFRIYDVNNDNLIDKQDLVSILKLMVGKYLDDARIFQIAERTLKEADKNCDGYVDFNEFCTVFSHQDTDLLKIHFRIHNN